MKAGYESVVEKHTYFDRVASILAELNLPEEAAKCINVKMSLFGVE